MNSDTDWDGWLIRRCRSEADSVRGVFPSIADALEQAADALEDYEAIVARLENQILQTEELATAAYMDADAAEAKLAAIEALCDIAMDPVGYSTYFAQQVKAVLHPEEAS